MVFQQPNPFAMSIFDNVAFGLRLNRFKGNMAERVEQALRRAALWDEVKDKLKKSGLSLSGGQQQRLCIARAIATEPTVLLMDEPCSALDPIATRRIEELMLELKKDYTIAIVTHNMQQAQRVADTTAFFSVDISKGGRTGYLVEIRPDRSRSSRARASSSPRSMSRPVQLTREASAMTSTQRRALLRAAIPLSVGLLGTGLPRAHAQSAAKLIRGAGATFPAPLYEKWIEAFAAGPSRVSTSPTTPSAAARASARFWSRARSTSAPATPR